MEIGMTLPVMEQVWAGEHTTDSVRPVGPSPAQPGGPEQLVGTMAPTTGFAGTASELRDVLARLGDLGADEVHLIPTDSDVVQVEQVAELAAGLIS